MIAFHPHANPRVDPHQDEIQIKVPSTVITASNNKIVPAKKRSSAMRALNKGGRPSASSKPGRQ